MRTARWLLACAVPDVAIVVAVLLFGKPSDLGTWRAEELLLAVPIGAACISWWVCLSSGNLSLLPIRLVRLEWRIAAILIATLLSIAVTLVGFICELQIGASEFTKDIFAAWVGSVAFFGLVGVVVSVVSLSNAAEESFPTRVRVLVRGRSGPHIDDFTERLKTSLAHYAESVTRTLTVTNHDSAAGMYQLRVEIETVIRSFVDDIDTVYESKVSYTPDHFPPPGRFHKLVKITGVACDSTPIESTTDAPIIRDYKATVPRGGACRVAFTLDIWVRQATEAITYSSIRYSLSTTVRIDHELKHALRIRVRWHDEAETQETIPPGVAPLITQKLNLKQGQRLHTLVLEPP